MRMDLATRIFKLLWMGRSRFCAPVEGNAAGAGFPSSRKRLRGGSLDAKFSCAFIKVGIDADVGAIWSLLAR